jgi:monoterpene epsilon-lactone hydrolase
MRIERKGRVMISIRSRLIKFFLVKHLMRSAFDPFKASIEEIRQKAAKMSGRIKLPKDAHIDRINIGGINAEWLRASSMDEKLKKVILYFHSGGFCLEYGNNHREFALRISRICNAKILAIDYRLAPEHAYPASNEDCFASYQWLLRQGHKPEDIIIGGDSSGAGLALMTLLAIRDSGTPLPRAAFFLSLMGGDLRDFDGASYESRKNRDPLNSKEVIQRYGAYYLGSTLVDPPIKKDLKGLPPLCIQVGDDEVLLSDSLLLARKAEEAGVKVVFETWKGMWHVFQGFAMMMPEAKRAIDSLGEFINSSSFG